MGKNAPRVILALVSCLLPVGALAQSPGNQANAEPQVYVDTPFHFPDGTRVGSSLAPGSRVVFLGDSIEIRGGSDTNWVTAAWPSHFMLRNGSSVVMLHNAGIAGNTCAQMIARFAADVAAYKPDNVFLKCGTNDVGAATPTATILSQIQQLVRLIKAIPATPILCTIPPRVSTYHTAVQTVNAGVRRIALTSHLPLVDFYSALVDPATGSYLAAMNSGDSVHPSGLGARAMADAAIAATANIWHPYRTLLAMDNTDANNLAQSALFLTDTIAGGGQTAGDGVADNWFPIGSGGFSLTTDTNILGKWQTITRAAGILTVVSRNIVSGFAVGDRIAFVGRVKSTGYDTCLAASTGVTAKVWLDFNQGTQLLPVSSGWDVDLQGSFYMESLVPAGVNVITANVSAGGSNCASALSAAQIGVYNLTALGIAAM